MSSQQDAIALMHRMWDNAKKYHTKIETTKRRLKSFGIKRFIFICRFSSIRKKLAYYEQARFNYVAMALSISRKLHIAKREARRRRHFDH